MFFQTKEEATANECTSVACQFDTHRLMEEGQSFYKSHEMPPLGDYLLHIAPAATRATANKTMMQNTLPFAGHFDVRGGAPVLYRAHWPMKVVWGFPKSHKRRHPASTCSNITQSDMLTPDFGGIFHRQINKKGLELTFWPIITIGVWHIKLTGTT